MESTQKAVRLDRIISGLPLFISAYEKVRDDKDDWLKYFSDFNTHYADWYVYPIVCTEPIFRAIAEDYGEAGESLDYDLCMSNLETQFADVLEIIYSAVPRDRVALCSFSRLGPGVDLPLHEHDNEGSLVLHMGLDIPDCEEGEVGLEHDGGTHYWNEPGDWIVFQDYRKHRAWNLTDQQRVILYLDFHV